MVEHEIILFLVFLKNLYTDVHGINLYSTNYVYKLLIHYLTEFIFLAIVMFAIVIKVRWECLVLV